VRTGPARTRISEGAAMKGVVFVGPTLAGRAFDTGPDIALLPPARQGDLWRAARGKVRAIGLIDGAFETVPSVWHKEILFALSRGIRVYGAASMGALRAAELHPFGMTGIGKIFRDYRSGQIESDDAVAVLHAPGEEGFRQLGEALVDIRATLEAAARARVVSAKTARSLEQLAQETFFKDRTWHRLAALGAADGLSKRELARLTDWLPENRVEQKCRDALALIAAMRRHLLRRAPPFHPRFTFQHTAFWQTLIESERAGSVR
jgi:hypothetical protein